MNRYLVLIVLVTLLVSSASLGQEAEGIGQHGRKTLNVRKIETPATIDGVLDERVWQEADVATGFLQKDPHEGRPATEPTEVRVLYDGKNLYFGVHCLDSDPDGILARELRRDNPLQNDDTFTIILDTFHDHRNAFLFRINPRGTQYDALITEEDRLVNASWDERWEVETHIHDQGWSAEIKIPLESIRFSSSHESVVFGMDFERVLRRKNEFTYWNNFRRDFNFSQISQGGHLVGLDDLQAGLRLRIKPYVFTSLRTRGLPGERRNNVIGDVGLEVVKVPINSGLTLDFTVNPDFAQTEVDEQVIDFSRVPTFFPEKREFFLEGAGIFEFGRVHGSHTPEVQLYHSRRIGLSPDRQPIPIVAGVKLTGRLGERFTLAALNIQTDEQGGRPGDNFAVFRLKRDLFSRSSAGIFVTNRWARGGNFNRVVGIDQDLVFYEHLKVLGLLARSFTKGVSTDQSLGSIGVSWTDDFLQTGFDYTVIDQEFRSDIGFLRREGVRRYFAQFGILPRPGIAGLRQAKFAVRLHHYRRLEDNSLETENYLFDHNFRFQNGSSIRFHPRRQVEDLRNPLPLTRGLVVTPGYYKWWAFPINYFFNPARKLTGSLGYGYEKDYYGTGGRRQSWDFSPVLNLNEHVSASINYALNRIELPGSPPVNVHLTNSRLNLSFSRKWMTSILFQYSNTRELIGMNFRLRYNYRSGDDLYIVVNTFRRGHGLLADIDRSIVVKFAHSFDF